MDLGFGDALLIFGGLLTLVAALSGVMKGTVLSARRALADRPRGHLCGGHLEAGAELGAPHAQPRVRPQRRLGAAFVLFFLVLATSGGDAGTEAAKLAGEAGVGAAIGLGLGALGGRLHTRLPGGGLTQRYEGIYAVGFALFVFDLADVTFGNGLIAAFVCGIAMAATERECPTVSSSSPRTPARSSRC